jgi:tetratricopeptide (TPR) repeat protein
MSSKDSSSSNNKNNSQIEEVKFSERINDFMNSNRKIFIVLGIAILIIVIAIGVVTFISQDLGNKATLAMEKLESELEVWTELQDESDKKTASTEIMKNADSLILKYSKQYASSRASVIKAQIQLSNNDPEGAERTYIELAERLPESHMAPVSLVNASSIAEDRGQNDKAIAYLEKAIDKYPATPGFGRILLSLGRIYEQNKQYDKAKEAYGKLIAAGVESDWTKLAHDRIILMKSLGLSE